MKFDELDKDLRVYETAYDFCVPPNTYIVARLDGRGFTKLTKKGSHGFEKPFDPRFRDMMVETTRHLMNSGFKVLFGYTQSDEISLLFDLGENLFSRKTRKINSVLAGEASAKFSLLLGDMGVFDCRLSLLPAKRNVVDYFRWRNEDAFRNSLNGHCYWLLRKQGRSYSQASKALEGKNTSWKNELLFQSGTNFNDLPAWQKRGTCLYWTKVEKQGWNPVKEVQETALRQELIIDMELPVGDAYSEYLANLI